jgi:hypothetical protein
MSGNLHVSFNQALAGAVQTAKHDRDAAIAGLKKAVEDSDGLRLIAEERLEHYENEIAPTSAYGLAAKSLLIDALGSRRPQAEEQAA